MKRVSKHISWMSILVFGLSVSSCKGHDHDHDDEHSTINMQIVKDKKSIAFSIETHGCELEDKNTKKEISLKDFENQLNETITFKENVCKEKVKKSTMREEGHHEIFLVDVSFECEKEVSSVDFHFTQVYDAIKKINVKVLNQDKATEETIDANGSLNI